LSKDSHSIRKNNRETSLSYRDRVGDFVKV
jgi:hypothetical protein